MPNYRKKIYTLLLNRALKVDGDWEKVFIKSVRDLHIDLAERHIRKMSRLGAKEIYWRLTHNADIGPHLHSAAFKGMRVEVADAKMLARRKKSRKRKFRDPELTKVQVDP